MKHLKRIDEAVGTILERRASAETLLKAVVKGNTTEVEGIELSKQMAQGFLDWLQYSTYGKKFGALPFYKLFTASFNWGLDRFVKGANTQVKGEFKELKAKAKEMSKAEMNKESVVTEAKMEKEFAFIAARVKEHDLRMKIANELFPKIAKKQKDGKFVNFKPLSQKQRDQVYAEFTKRVTDALKESVNERFKHNDMYAMLDIAAQYSSTQHQAANQMWSDEQDLYDYLKSDHIPKKYHKDFYNDVKRRFKGVNESVNEGQNNPVDKKFIRDWEKLCLAMIGRLKIDMRKAPVESKSLFTKNIKRIEDVLDVPTEISYFTEGNGLVKEGLSKSAIKKQIKIVSKMIEDEEGGDGEPLTNETLQDLGRELIRLKSLIESYRMS
jgi:hypothetical protein